MRKRKKKKVSTFKIVLLGVGIALGIICLCLYLDTKTAYHLRMIDANGVCEEIQTYNSFTQAKANMLKLDHQENENYEITTDKGKRLALRYGIVNFRTKECSVNTSYQIEDRKEEGYTNGCYGADAAYLDTSSDGKKVKFLMGGVTGWVAMDDIELLNYYDTKEVASVSHYVVSDQTFLHKGTTDVKKSSFAFSIDVGMPLEESAYSYYYSYDGHYFYPSFSSMIDDYQKDTRKNSVNSETPYYNYYQYLSHRSKSNYSAQDINTYISKVLGYTSAPAHFPMEAAQSMLYQSGSAFINAQNKYSTNAIMMLSLSINETAYGTSQLAFEKNNLFGHAAYDASPSKSANKYASAAESIEVHASVFLNQGYLNSCDGAQNADACDSSNANRYRGAYFGDKESGMNVRYASDPYWGEKAAAFYRKFDTAMGLKDQKFPILIKNVENAPLYEKPDKKSTVLYKTPTVNHYSFYILDTIKNGKDTWYKVKSDAPIKKGSVDLEASAYDETQGIVYVNSKDLH